MTLIYIQENSYNSPSSSSIGFDDNDSVGAQIEYSSSAAPLEADLEAFHSVVDEKGSVATKECSEANFELAELPGRKYRYNVPVDVNDDDKGTGFRFLSARRPHMRAFWGTNVAHRATVFMWFSAVPLYS